MVGSAGPGYPQQQQQNQQNQHHHQHFGPQGQMHGGLVNYYQVRCVAIS